MGLNQLDIGRIDLILVIDFLLQARLRFRIRRGNAVGLAVLIDTPSLDDSVNDVAIPLRVGQPLEHYDAHAFTWNETVSSLIERHSTCPLARAYLPAKS